MAEAIAPKVEYGAVVSGIDFDEKRFSCQMEDVIQQIWL